MLKALIAVDGSGLRSAQYGMPSGPVPSIMKRSITWIRGLKAGCEGIEEKRHHE